MRITFVMAAADLSGGNRVISIYANRLRRRGHQVTLVSRPWKTATITDKAIAWLRGVNPPPSKPYGPSHFDSLEGIEHRRLETFRNVTAIDVPDADAVIATWWETAEWVATLPATKGKKFYFIQHYEVHPGQDAGRVQATWRLPLQKIVIANWLMEIAHKQFEDYHAALVPNAVDLLQFNAPPRGKQPVPTVGVMYSAVQFKGFDISLAAITLARKKLTNLQVVAFGNREPLESLPLPQQTDFTMRPPQDQIKNIYARCDVWLVGSRSEGFGLPILEAMACRTPVIATPTGAAPELIARGGGVITPMEDAPAMAQNIERIVTLSEDQWQAMSAAAFNTASRYTWDDATDLFEAVLERRDA